jgi:hypothetical protein
MLSVEVLLVQASEVKDTSSLLATSFGCLSQVLVIQRVMKISRGRDTLGSSRIRMGFNLITYETLIANFDRKNFGLFILMATVVVGIALALLSPLLVLGRHVSGVSHIG